MYSPNTSPKKPSPLGYQNQNGPASPRASPFKRPQSSNSHPTTPNTPRSPATKLSSRPGTAGQYTPTRASHAIDEEDDTSDVFTAPSYPTQQMRPPSRGASPVASRSLPPAPASHSTGSPKTMTQRPTPGASNDAASKVPPALLREMHESFQAMDGDGDGQVGSVDVAEALGQLGQNAHPATLTTFFPPGTSSTIGLPSYINALSEPLSAMSAPAELAAAFSAFDADDSGQIDVAELREALLVSHDGGAAMTPAQVDAVLGEFSGKRAFAKGAVGNRGDVFRWRDFVNATGGGPEKREDVKA